MAGHDDEARQQWSGRLRAGLAAAAVATMLLTVAGESSPASASPAPGSAAAGGYLYWSNTIGPILKPGDGVIVRALRNGTDVNQNFITGASLPGMIVVFGGYLYWANIAPIRNGAGTIGRARLNGTNVNQRFVARKDFLNLHGVAVRPGRH